MPMPLYTQSINAGGANVAAQPAVSDLQGGILKSDLHARFYQAAYQGKVFFAGMGLTAINNVTFTSATLGATCTPVAGVVNPSNSTVNLEFYQAILGLTITAATATGGAPFVWAISAGNGVASVFSTGLAPYNRKTFLRQGSQALNVSGVALTGLTNNLVVAGASALTGGQATSVTLVEGTVAAPPSIAGGVTAENFDGSITVAPGCVLALLATTTPVAHSAVSGLVWAEWPV